MDAIVAQTDRFMDGSGERADIFTDGDVPRVEHCTCHLPKRHIIIKSGSSVVQVSSCDGSLANL